MFFHEYTVDEIFSFVSRSGLNALEFWLETPHFWLRDLPVMRWSPAGKSTLKFLQ